VGSECAFLILKEMLGLAEALGDVFFEVLEFLTVSAGLLVNYLESANQGLGGGVGELGGINYVI